MKEFDSLLKKPLIPRGAFLQRTDKGFLQNGKPDVMDEPVQSFMMKTVGWQSMWLCAAFFISALAWGKRARVVFDFDPECNKGSVSVFCREEDKTAFETNHQHIHSALYPWLETKTNESLAQTGSRDEGND